MAAVLAFAVSSATAKDENSNHARARLDGYQETPTLSTTGHGQFEARINENSIDYTLTFADLESAVIQAHIHLGRPAIQGGVSAFLCGGGGKPACSTTATGTSGMVSGTIVAADVIGPATQGIAPGEFDELVRAMRASATYANVHSTGHPGGEIRGRIRVDNED
jgi:hypothetical protein